jgi:hypothetical protein
VICERKAELTAALWRIAERRDAAVFKMIESATLPRNQEFREAVYAARQLGQEWARVKAELEAHCSAHRCSGNQ